MRTATTMRAMRVRARGQPLSADRVPIPEPRDGEVLLRVAACGVCRTDLHLLDAELPGLRDP